MKIFYGANATGNGHINFAFTFAKAFSQRNDIEVNYIFSGRDKNKYFDMDCFGDYQIRDGITFIYEKGYVKHWESLKNLKPVTFFKDVKSLNLSSYDFVIIDGEPVLAWAAKLKKIPSIAISHLFSYYNHEISRISKDSLYPLKRLFIDKFVTRALMPCNINLGMFWYHFGSYNILPPFVEECSLVQSNTTDDSYLVYLPFEHIQDIKAMLQPFTGIDFLCYHPDITQNNDEGCIKWRVISRTNFKNSLQACKGIIANGGFYLASECLKFGKKLLIKPLLGQWEQISNAVILSHLGLAQNMKILSTEVIEQWLEQPSIDPISFPHDLMPVIDWIVSGNWTDTASLCKGFWDMVHFPHTLQEIFKRL